MERRESESAWKVSMVTFVSLCLIAYVILLLITLHPACRPAVYSVLVTLPPTLLLVCSFLLSTHFMIWSFHSLQTSSFQTLCPITSLFYCLYPILYLHLARFHPIISPVFFFNSKSITLYSIPGKMHVKEHTEGQRETSDSWMCQAGGGL